LELSIEAVNTSLFSSGQIKTPFSYFLSFRENAGRSHLGSPQRDIPHEKKVSYFERKLAKLFI
jgi:hypothetical protein